MVVPLKTDLRFPKSGQQGHGPRIIQEFAIEVQMMYKEGKDPFKYDFNRTDRKFGNSWEYRSVENATYEMLGMTTEESRQAFMKMYRN